MMIPNSLIVVFAIVGLFSSVHLLFLLAKYCVHWIKFKELPLSEDQEKIKFLRQHIDQQTQKIKSLEQETEKMTLALLNHIS